MSELYELDASQREAVMHFQGPALVLAGPGSGKTSVITNRIQCLTDYYRVPPEKILVVTFTKAAALEMQKRFEILAGRNMPVRFGTFHSIYYHILREQNSYRSNQLITEKEKRYHIKRAVRKYQVSADQKDGRDAPVSDEMLDQLLSAASYLKNRGGFPEDYTFPMALSGEEFYRIYQEYQRLLRGEQKLDFDDMILECRSLFQEQPSVLAEWQRRFAFILVDEFQDINPVQYEVIRMLAAPENNLFVVGDDDQSLYGFRGAGTEMILQFPVVFPDCAQYRLMTNYRCRGAIVDAAGKVIACNQKRFPKQIQAYKKEKAKGRPCIFCTGFAGMPEEYAKILNILRDTKRAEELGKTAVIFRKNRDMVYLKRLLAKEGIPYAARERGKTLREHFITLDLFAYLELAHGNLRRNYFYRVMNRPQREISRVAFSGEWVSWTELETFYAGAFNVLSQIRKWRRDCGRLEKMDPYAAVNYIRRGMGYEQYLLTSGQTADRGENMLILEELQRISGQHDSFEKFREWRKHEGEPHRKGGREDELGVRILTLHASKGLEFDRVILPDLNEGILPSPRAVTKEALEEERRMLYVGMTRAREELYLFYRTGTKKEPEEVSRFLLPLL